MSANRPNAKRHSLTASSRSASVRVQADGRSAAEHDADRRAHVLRLIEGERDSILAAESGLVLLGAVRECAKVGAAMPQWLADEYCRRYDAVLSYQVRSFDEAFGAPFPKNTKIDARRQRRELSFAIYFEVHRRHAVGAPIDSGLFEGVAEHFGVGKTTVIEIYSEMKERLDPHHSLPQK